ncbi:hypothetical protein DAPPUDRAFT_240584 [Daphnia pulex]|uniref:Uncharacterized protein n=1 Tax=Daphnia pulex TaxID=6669 RepID=E9GBW5_DAPPU|nr:hypothetical protein DAPPUDRAFT_240584 [Daphnia pulex]|eukprot:EFX83084.1 hypothetical protein DAPPUDRAFT_240584 [Daphnia pulex]
MDSAAKAEGIEHKPKNIAALEPGRIEEHSDMKTIRFLIENGQDISASTWGENGANALHVAAANKKTTELIDVILANGQFDINGVDNDGDTPLHHAIMGSFSTKNVHHLIQLGAEKLLNTEKLNVNDYDHNGLTALAYARSNKHGLSQRIIARFIEYGTNE